MKYVFNVVKSVSVLSLLLAILVIGFTNCNSSKQVAYFQNIPDSPSVEKRVRNAKFVEPTVNKGDILHIEVTTIDSKLGGITQQQQTDDGEKGREVSGYMVDKNGIVEVPIIGKVQVEGLTTTEVKDVVRNAALKFYKDPMVNVRIANFYITVLGEVQNPGRYIANNEKVSVLDAIGMAGDLSLGGKRNNVMIIREENGESVFTRVDLNSTDLFQSKFFYLQSGDKIYVEPLKSVARSGTSDKGADRWVSLSLGFVGLMIAAIGLITRLN